MKQNKETLKAYFETGDKPTQQQYSDLVDSYIDAKQPTGEPNRRFVIDKLGQVTVKAELKIPEFQSGTNITIDKTNPLKPIINSSENNINSSNTITKVLPLSSFITSDNFNYSFPHNFYIDTYVRVEIATNGFSGLNPIISLFDVVVNDNAGFIQLDTNKLDFGGWQIPADYLTNCKLILEYKKSASN
ncbi:hypothetical protein [Tenacibaculum halocynthiae]|uniref:hypothetical protein n=1 Tax=Tenacibaculum halocynthiae TaxID=1254437 RepID=UPI003D64E24E